MTEILVSDLFEAGKLNEGAGGLEQNQWVPLAYEAEGFSGRAILAPLRSKPSAVSVFLPAEGTYRIYVGLYASGEAPVWLHHHFGRQRGAKPWNRLRLRLSDEDYFDVVTPPDFPNQPAFGYISECYWKTAEVTGRSLVLAVDEKEAFLETTVCVAYVRLVKANGPEVWLKETKRLVTYYDGNFLGHFVDGVSDVKFQISPLKASDCEMIFWNTCREDTCFYPTRVGHTLPDHPIPGLYPHWMGRDLHRMLDRGEDPLEIACRVAHENGLKILGSYRRLTCRPAPHVFPLHPDATLVRRRDLWCVDEKGEAVPHLSLGYPEVRDRMIALACEQAERYDIDGLHFFFCRGVPFVLYERPFRELFIERFGTEPDVSAGQEDQRVWAVRKELINRFWRSLREKLNEIGDRRRRHFRIAVTVMNRPRTCEFFGLDIETMVREGLVDDLLPFPCHYLPPELGEWRCLPEHLMEFKQIIGRLPVRLYPDCGYDFSDGKLSLAERARAYYQAGADGMQVNQYEVRGYGTTFARRLGHIDELDLENQWNHNAFRAVRLKTISGFSMDRFRGLPTCG